jgi:hypothetical protein
MKSNFNITIRISRDSAGKPRFTKKEVQALIKDGKDLMFSKGLMVRISDKKVIGEITEVNIN